MDKLYIPLEIAKFGIISYMINKKTPVTDFDAYLAKQLKNKTIKKYFDKYGKQLEIFYQITKPRVPEDNRVSEDFSIS